MYKTTQFVSAYAWEKETHPFRTHMERHTILTLATDIENKSILDIACGSGCYSRLFCEHGAKKVIAIDSSQPMIDNAMANTPENMPIEYLLGNGESYRSPDKFDLVFHSYFLNYAASLDALNAMCHTISAHLNSGGYMLGIVSMLGKEPAGAVNCCDFYTSFDKQPDEGEAYEIHFRDQNESIINFNWSQKNYENSLHKAGLQSIDWHTPKYRDSPRMTQENWQQLTRHPVFLAVTASQ